MGTISCQPLTVFLNDCQSASWEQPPGLEMGVPSTARPRNNPSHGDQAGEGFVALSEQQTTSHDEPLLPPSPTPQHREIGVELCAKQLLQVELSFLSTPLPSGCRMQSPGRKTAVPLPAQRAPTGSPAPLLPALCQALERSPAQTEYLCSDLQVSNITLCLNGFFNLLLFFLSIHVVFLGFQSPSLILVSE